MHFSPRPSLEDTGYPSGQLAVSPFGRHPSESLNSADFTPPQPDTALPHELDRLCWELLCAFGDMAEKLNRRTETLRETESALQRLRTRILQVFL